MRQVKPAAFTKKSTLGVKEQRVNLLIDVFSPAKDLDGLGYADQLYTRIPVFSRDETTIIPTDALFRTGHQWSVYAVQDGRAQRRTVELLRRSGRFAAVSAGCNRETGHRLPERSHCAERAGRSAIVYENSDRRLSAVFPILDMSAAAISG